VAVVKSKAFERDKSGGIISFYAKDKNNVEVKITLHEPAPEEIVDAEVVEILGHMHGNSITASKISIIK
jgi:cytochrome c-type biogenesis protein CcmE